MVKSLKPASGSERQRRYRASRLLVSIDITRATADALAALRVQTGLPTDALVAASLRAMSATLKPAQGAELFANGVSDAGKERVHRSSKRAPGPSPGDISCDGADGRQSARRPPRRKATTSKVGDIGAKPQKNDAEAKPSSASKARAQGTLNLFGDQEV